ncbi:MAG: dTDP-4-dehydrorhamnose 3,5-epimerase [Methylomonas sp.]|jgi:dTDP-4-dehydrorhamnose 3,5-epimerase|uniref:dTDP-4-dehydrorhamnose 3,5-epimerase n=1 Tax=Methylomonas sp. TaxID=418 RepID=UPI0025EDE668|nr:dTDP-4-dehydrorhamnose 3,5-epimerase [Methylomonas sp.]MCK9607897.1 dTDP-4-dehydrorhamnose 3,5-epimerase [Methylomonas sp.]
MNLRQTKISGVVIVESAVFKDHRGAFSRLYCEQELNELIGTRRIVQINHSLTNAKGAVRGMHFQHPPHAEMKLIRCLNGRVWDIAVDLRQDSPTFLQWHAEELSADSPKMMVIPEGCAHGFQVLESESELLYLHTAFYQPSAEAGLRHDDPRLAITWPLPVTDLSVRDRQHALIPQDFFGIKL